MEENAYPGYDSYWRCTRSNYLGMLRLINDQVDRLTRHLESSGKLENTILLYLADHGDYFCDYGLVRKGAGQPEALTRIPMIWMGWGIRPQAGHPAFVSTADVMPTLCEAIGAPIPQGAQGRSLWPLLQGRDYPHEEFESICSEVGFGGLHYTAGDRIDPRWGRIPGGPGAIPSFDELNPVTQSGNVKMIRRGDWKLAFDMMGHGELYHLAQDPYELKNLYDDPGGGGAGAPDGGFVAVDHSHAGRPSGRGLCAEMARPQLVRSAQKRLNRARPAEEVHQDGDHRQDQQQVNQPAGHVKRGKTQEPEDQQNEK